MAWTPLSIWSHKCFIKFALDAFLAYTCAQAERGGTSQQIGDKQTKAKRRGLKRKHYVPSAKGFQGVSPAAVPPCAISHFPSLVTTSTARLGYLDADFVSITASAISGRLPKMYEQITNGICAFKSDSRKRQHCCQENLIEVLGRLNAPMRSSLATQPIHTSRPSPHAVKFALSRDGYRVKTRRNFSFKRIFEQRKFHRIKRIIGSDVPASGDRPRARLPSLGKVLPGGKGVVSTSQNLLEKYNSVGKATHISHIEMPTQSVKTCCITCSLPPPALLPAAPF